MKRIQRILLFFIITMIAMLCYKVQATENESSYFEITDVSGNIGQAVEIQLKTKKDLTIEDASLDLKYPLDKLEAQLDTFVISDAVKGLCNMSEIGEREKGTISCGLVAIDGITIPANTIIYTGKFKILEESLGKNEISLESAMSSSSGDINDGNVKANIIGIKQITTFKIEDDEKKTSREVIFGKVSTIDLVVTLLPESYNTSDIAWESSNKDVATIENGKITIVGVGKTEITAKILNEVSKYELVVKNEATGDNNKTASTNNGQTTENKTTSTTTEQTKETTTSGTKDDTKANEKLPATGFKRSILLLVVVLIFIITKRKLTSLKSI